MGLSGAEITKEMKDFHSKHRLSEFWIYLKIRGELIELMSSLLNKIIKEGSVQIYISEAKKISKELPVFYNPIMASNRNICILLLNCINNEQMNLADPLAGSGIRSLRFLKELKEGKVKRICVNDFKENFIKVFNNNLKLNKLSHSLNQRYLSQEDANLFLLKEWGFDYIDLDVFGSPNPFLANAVAKISREGIIAVTATDTAALTGTYPKVTRRKYWAEPLRNYLMHEIGLRILIRRIQLQGVQFDKALIPLLSYSKDHYYRVYVRNDRHKEACDEILKQHQYFLFCPKCLNFKCSKFNKEKCVCGNEFIFAGPLWTGQLYDAKLLEKMVDENNFPEEHQFLNILLEESKSKQVGFIDLHELARIHKKNPLPMELELKKRRGVRTQFSAHGVKKI